MKTSTVVAVLAPAALVVVLAACPGDQRNGTSSNAGPASAAPSMARVPDNRQQLLAWLLCVECSGGELQAVVALGNSADSTATIDSLRQDVLGGPSPQRRDNIRLQFDSAYTEDSIDAVEEGSAPVLTRAQYVQPLLNNFVNTYRLRAARALAKIGGPVARGTLDSALTPGPLSPGDTLSANARVRMRLMRDSVAP
jgi:hypothetical protein